MNFLQACEKLRAGRCEGMQLNSNRIFKINRAGGFLIDDDGGEFAVSNLDWLLSNGWQLINPEPVMETVEVKRWFRMDMETGETSGISYLSEGDAGRSTPGRTVVELTGTYQRPVKEKVKRREEILPGKHFNFSCGATVPGSNARYFAEWTE